MRTEEKLQLLEQSIQVWAREGGFQATGVTYADTSKQQVHLERWLKQEFHGSMNWMAEQKELRLHPEKLHPGTARVISFRMDYLPPDTQLIKVLKSPEKAYVSRYALGRDYHKLVRKRLANIAKKIEAFCAENKIEESIQQRPFVDSAPVLERPLAADAGLGWIGKHTLLLHEKAGSWFFLGEIFTNIPLPVNNKRAKNQCGDCQACLQVCPTDAFPEPYVLDARRCISYLTIENKETIPEEYREVMGNRVFGCDDCQAICPWNKYANFSNEPDFNPRHNLANADLRELFTWDEKTYLERTAGSAIRRIGYHGWLRNLSVGLGNAPTDDRIIEQLKARLEQSFPEWLKEHFHWALQRQIAPPKRRKRKLRRE